MRQSSGKGNINEVAKPELVVSKMENDLCCIYQQQLLNKVDSGFSTKRIFLTVTSFTSDKKQEGCFQKNKVNLNMLLKAETIKSCYIGPQISPEQFIEEHFFLYLVKGQIHGYDGHQNFTLTPGQCCLVRKNRLARYNKEKENDEFEKIVVIFDQKFLKDFMTKHLFTEAIATDKHAFIRLNQNELIPHFIKSLVPYYDGGAKINERFSNVKREELLLILLQFNPELSAILFDFGIPEKINLEEFMNRNYRFNVSMERFAYLTGRSLSVFKKDFARTFGDTPSRWLIKKRLQEAHFQIHKEGKKPSEIYLNLGFEDLSHFSFAFKKQFGVAPSRL